MLDAELTPTEILTGDREDGGQRVVMSDIVAQLDHTIDRQRVLAALAMTPEERLLAGAQMFDAACDDLMAMVKNAFPHASPDAVQSILREIVRVAERRGIL